MIECVGGPDGKLECLGGPLDGQGLNPARGDFVRLLWPGWTGYYRRDGFVYKWVAD